MLYIKSNYEDRIYMNKRLKDVYKRQLVRNDNDGELIDGSGKGGSHEREYPFAWAAYPPCGINNVSHGTRLL